MKRNWPRGRRGGARGDVRKMGRTWGSYVAFDPDGQQMDRTCRVTAEVSGLLLVGGPLTTKWLWWLTAPSRSGTDGTAKPRGEKWSSKRETRVTQGLLTHTSPFRHCLSGSKWLLSIYNKLCVLALFSRWSVGFSGRAWDLCGGCSEHQKQREQCGY